MINDIQQAIEKHLRLLPGEIARWNSYEPKIGVPWLLASTPVRMRNPMGPSKNTPYLWTGTLVLVVKQPMLDGPAPAGARAMAIAEHFPRGKTLTEGAAKVIIEDSSPMSEQRSADWLGIPVHIRWQCTEPGKP